MIEGTCSFVHRTVVSASHQGRYLFCGDLWMVFQRDLLTSVRTCYNKIEIHRL